MKRLVTFFGVFLALSLTAAPTLFKSDVEMAFKNAKANKKFLLIDFYGIWCPPCNQLNETVFDTPTFFQKAKAFELLQVDADATASWKIKDRYKVGGYPTIIFANSSGDELYRIVGYRSLAEFSRVMDLVVQSKGKSAAKSCTSKNDDDLWRCAVTCMEKKDVSCAEKALGKLEGKLKPKTARYDLARSFAAENSPTVDLKIKAVQSLLEQFPESPYALYWSLLYWDAVQEQKVASPKKDLFDPVLNNYTAMKMDPRREELGVTLSDMAQMKADLLGKLDRREEAKAAWKEAAEVLTTLASELPTGVSDRGFMIEKINCLDMAGETDAALALASEYRQKYPKEFTFHYIAASILDRKKRYNEALPISQRAYELSYGDNRIRAGIQLIHLYATVPNLEEAKKIYLEVKSQAAPDAKTQVRTHRYLKHLDEMWHKMAKQ